MSQFLLLTISLAKYYVHISILFPVWQLTFFCLFFLLLYPRSKAESHAAIANRFCCWLVPLLFPAFGSFVIQFEAEAANVSSVRVRFHDRLTKDVAEKMCKVMNEKNKCDIERDCAGMWCSLTDYSQCAETKRAREQRVNGMITLPPHKRKWGFHGTGVVTRKHAWHGIQRWPFCER